MKGIKYLKLYCDVAAVMIFFESSVVRPELVVKICDLFTRVESSNSHAFLNRLIMTHLLRRNEG